MTVWMAYAVAALAASTLFGFAGWQSRRTARAPRRAGQDDFDWIVPTEADMMGTTQADVAAAVRAALGRVHPLLTRQFVHIDVAVPPELNARMRGASLIDAIEEMLTAAIQAAPASRLLLTALAQGDHIEIAVTDDMPGADQAFRLGQVRGLSERTALRGGSLHIAVHPTEGTTTALRVAAASPAPAAAESVPAMPAHQASIGAAC